MGHLEGTAAGPGWSEEWRAVFASQYPGIVRHLSYLVGDRGAAEDLAQETFLRLMRHPLREAGDPGPWLRLVATRLAYNYLRTDRRRRAREETVLRDGTLLAAPSAGEAQRDEAVARMRAALVRLPPRDRLALLLRASGEGYAHIAPAVGVRPSSVGTILARATARLRREYARECGRDLVGAEGLLATEGVRTP